MLISSYTTIWGCDDVAATPARQPVKRSGERGVFSPRGRWDLSPLAVVRLGRRMAQRRPEASGNFVVVVVGAETRRSRQRHAGLAAMTGSVAARPITEVPIRASGGDVLRCHLVLLEPSMRARRDGGVNLFHHCACAHCL